MRSRIAALIFGLGCLAAAPAGAMPVAPLAGFDAADVTLVAQGCGPGGWRGPYGHCRYGGAPGVYVAPHRGPYYGPRPYYGPPRGYGRHCWWRNGVRVCN